MGGNGGRATAALGLSRRLFHLDRKSPVRQLGRKPEILASLLAALIASALSIAVHNASKSFGEIVEISTNSPLNPRADERLGNTALKSLNVGVLRAVDLLNPLAVDANRKGAHSSATLLPVAVLPVSRSNYVIKAVHHGAGVHVGQNLAPHLASLGLAIAANAPVDVLGGEGKGEPLEVLIGANNCQ